MKKGGRGGKRKQSPGALLVGKRWKKTTEEQRKELGRKLAEARKRARLERELGLKKPPQD